MTLGQLERLLIGDFKSLIGLSEEEMEIADLEDIQKVAEAWSRVELKSAKNNYDGSFVVDGIVYAMLTDLHEPTVAEVLLREKAFASDDIALLIALFSRPVMPKLLYMKKEKDKGTSYESMLKVARLPQPFMPAGFNESRTLQRAEMFRQKMSASRALLIASFYSTLSEKLNELLNAETI